MLPLARGLAPSIWTILPVLVLSQLWPTALTTLTLLTVFTLKMLVYAAMASVSYIVAAFNSCLTLKICYLTTVNPEIKCGTFIPICIYMMTMMRYYLQASVMMETLGWWVEQLSMKDVWKFAGMKFGVLCVMISGLGLMLQLPADSLDSLPQARHWYLMKPKRSKLFVILSFSRCNTILPCLLWPGYWSHSSGWLTLQQQGDETYWLSPRWNWHT